MPEQSRESEKKFITLEKDIEHLQYIIKETKSEIEFLKKHFTTKNNDRLADIKVLHGRIEQHQTTDLEFHENVRQKISEKFNALDERIKQLDKWKWATWGALMVVGALIGSFSPIALK